MSRPVVLLLGGGSNVGEAVIKQWSRQFHIAIVSRNRNDGVDASGVFSIAADLSDPEVVPSIFNKVKEHWGQPPTIVIYNAAARTLLSPKDPVTDITLAQYQKDHNTNVVSALVALQHTLKGFAKLPPSTLKTFFYTGNKLKARPLPPVLTFGMDKAAMAHAIWDCTIAYTESGYKFYFPDERFADGALAGEERNGEALAEMMLALVEDPMQQAWYHTFVKGKGYTDFEEVDRQADRARQWT